jgi:hypothetical protein
MIVRSPGSEAARAVSVLSCSVFMFPLLRDPASRTFIVSEGSLASVYIVSSSFHCFASDEE